MQAYDTCPACGQSEHYGCGCENHEKLKVMVDPRDFSDAQAEIARLTAERDEATKQHPQLLATIRAQEIQIAQLEAERDAIAVAAFETAAKGMADYGSSFGGYNATTPEEAAAEIRALTPATPAPVEVGREDTDMSAVIRLRDGTIKSLMAQLKCGGADEMVAAAYESAALLAEAQQREGTGNSYFNDGWYACANLIADSIRQEAALRAQSAQTGGAA